MKCFNSTPKKQKIYKGTFQGEWESSPPPLGEDLEGAILQKIYIRTAAP